jgi:predicted deacylase
VLRFGTPGARPKAYLQAALHADEIPGLLVQQKLVHRLQAAEEDALITGEIVVVPVANPIGSDQHLLGMHQGRYEQGTGVNFNRAYPDLSDSIAEQAGEQLGADASANTKLIRAAALDNLSELPQSEDAALKHTLLKLAIDADIVLDLHCDSEAVLHVYVGTPLWPDAQDLPAQLGAPLTLLASVSGGNPFDEACSGLWWALAERFPQHPIDPACLAAATRSTRRAAGCGGRWRNASRSIPSIRHAWQPPWNCAANAMCTKTSPSTMHKTCIAFYSGAG